MIQGVRHRFRDKWRSKSPDYTLEDTASQSSNYQFPAGNSLPRAASLMSTDYGFNDEWGFDKNGTKVAALNPMPFVPQPGTTHQTVVSEVHFNSYNSVQERHCEHQSKLSHAHADHNAFSIPPDKKASVSRAVSMNTVNHFGIHNNGTIHRGKSVRFGENRISVFMQDSTQALEECVRLALSYAEETKRGDYCSDSEAVTLSRQLSQGKVSLVLFTSKKH